MGAPAAIGVIALFGFGLVPILCGVVAVRLRGTRRRDDGEDDANGNDDGGRPRRPLPEPPALGPDGIDWDRFDRVRDDWDVARRREPHDV